MPNTSVAVRATLFTVLAVLLAGCIPVKNVERAWSTAEADPALAGQWLNPEKGTVASAFVNTDRGYQVFTDRSDFHGGVRTFETNGHKYMIVADLHAALLGFDQVDADDKGGILLRYAVEGDTLTIYTYESERLGQAVEDGDVAWDESDEAGDKGIPELDDKTIAWLGRIADGPGWESQVFTRKK